MREELLRQIEAEQGLADQWTHRAIGTGDPDLSNHYALLGILSLLRVVAYELTVDRITKEARA